MKPKDIPSHLSNGQDMGARFIDPTPSPTSGPISGGHVSSPTNLRRAELRASGVRILHLRLRGHLVASTRCVHLYWTPETCHEDRPGEVERCTFDASCQVRLHHMLITS